jgi:Flp pilus assembly protein TadG
MRAHRRILTGSLSRLHRLGVHNGGSAAVMAAILFPVVVGGLGLGAETGYWYLSQRKLQHVVDVSVHAAGARKRAGDTDDMIVAAALHVATASGLPASATLAVDPNYTSAAYPGAELVEAIATETQPRLFSSVFSNDPVTFSARAVAKITATPGSVACVLALSTTAPRAVNADGSFTMVLDNCDVASNSNAGDSVYVTSSVSTGCAYSVGGAHTPGLTLTACDNVKVNAPLIRDPYASVAAPTSWSNCSSRHQGHPTSPSPNLTPRCFSGGLTVKGALHFEPGLYVIDGGEFAVNSGDNARLTGSGVTFYLANGAKLNIGGSVQLNFTAPSDAANPYAGILFFGDRTATDTNHVLAGNSNSDYTGAVYTPASRITFAGNSTTSGGGCTQVIGNTVTFTGNSNLRSSCPGGGTTNIDTNVIVEIVE